jgi:hypothetical protein
MQHVIYIVSAETHLKYCLGLPHLQAEMSAVDLQSIKNIVLVDCRWQKGSSILKNPLLAGMRYVLLTFQFHCMLSCAKTTAVTVIVVILNMV